MIGKVEVRSYKSKWSKQVNRKCRVCKKRLPAQLVDYGKGGQTLFFRCGHCQDVEVRK